MNSKNHHGMEEEYYMRSHFTSSYQWEIQRPEKLSNLSKISQLLHDRVHIRTQIFWFQNIFILYKKEMLQQNSGLRVAGTTSVVPWNV